MDANKLLTRIALTKIKGLGISTIHKLLKKIGNEEEIFKLSLKELMFDCKLSKEVAQKLKDPDVLKIAEKELLFIEKNNIGTFYYLDDNYPSRLKSCEDAPILLYFKGNCNLEQTKVISIVGTRDSTAYGNEFCSEFIKQLSERYKDILIVSGLAYGIDIHAHKAALKYNVPTIGVLAHGLDRIYPAEHRQSAIAMLENGGLLTEFTSMTKPERFNFVMRNRIVAGLSDAIVVVESNKKGGALITAQLGNSYCRDVFAVPGKMMDSRSEGCNALIANHQADLFLSFEYFLEQMNWEISKEKVNQPIQQELFISVEEDEQPIYDLLKKGETLHIDVLSRELNIETFNLLPLLLQMEMKGIIKTLPGSIYSV